MGLEGMLVKWKKRRWNCDFALSRNVEDAFIVGLLPASAIDTGRDAHEALRSICIGSEQRRQIWKTPTLTPFTSIRLLINAVWMNQRHRV